MDDLYAEAINVLAHHLSHAVSCPRYAPNNFEMECPAEMYCVYTFPSVTQPCEEILVLWATRGEGI